MKAFNHKSVQVIYEGWKSDEGKLKFYAVISEKNQPISVQYG